MAAPNIATSALKTATNFIPLAATATGAYLLKKGLSRNPDDGF